MVIEIKQKGDVWTFNGKLYSELESDLKIKVDELLKATNLEKTVKNEKGS